MPRENQDVLHDGGRTTRSMRRWLRLWRRRLAAADRMTQAEQEGMYSVERTLQLQAYAASTSLRRCILTMIAMPVPCLGVILLIDAVPLNPTSAGLEHSQLFWCRVLLVACLITFTVLEQLRVLVPQLPNQTTTSQLVTSTLIGAGCIACAIPLASVVGFPLPFIYVFSSPFWLLFFWLAVGLRWGRLLFGNRALRHQVTCFYQIIIVQVSLTLIYPVYNHIFITLTGHDQTAFALLLPVIKHCIKIVFARVFKHSEDCRPLVIIFNAHIFHALFASIAMQGSTSALTSAVVIVTNILLAWRSVRRIQRLCDRLDSHRASLNDQQANEHQQSILDHALVFTAMDPELVRGSSIRIESSATTQTGSVRSSTKNCFHGSSAIVRPAAVVSTALETPPPEEDRCTLHTLRCLRVSLCCQEFNDVHRILTRGQRREYVTTALHTLHIVESLILVKFVEVMVPLIYTGYLVSISHLPNRAYYPRLASMTEDKLTSTIKTLLGFVAIELLSFMAVGFVLSRKLGSSLVHQLAFVLHAQWRLVQSYTVLWVVAAVQISLEHFGYDFSLKFAWLQNQA